MDAERAAHLYRLGCRDAYAFGWRDPLADPEDFVQDAFVALLESNNVEAPTTGYFLQILRHKIVSHIQRTAITKSGRDRRTVSLARQGEGEGEPLGETLPARTNTANQAIANLTLAALADLARRDRNVATAIGQGLGYSVAELASTEGAGEPALRSRLSRLRRGLLVPEFFSWR